MKMTKRISVVLAVLMVMLLGACSNEPANLTAAPLGDRSALESLADSYRKVSEKTLSTSPHSLPGDERRHFVELVFKRSGYSYTKTLHEMAEKGIDKKDQLQVDLAELVLMPHRDLSIPTELTDIYSGQELQDVAVVERQLNM
jgi:hypothetical protein